MVKPCFHVSSISCFLFVSSFFVNSLVSQPFPRPDQIEILLAFKNEFPILKCDFKKWPSSRKLTKSWTRNDVKSFSGVFFDSETGVVTVLKMRGACLSGTLNANSSLFRLHHLRYLDLSFNYLDSFPFLPQLGKLTNLESLDLSHMGLPGEIPSSISSLNRLTKLDLSDNELTGTFSPLLNLSRLSSLSLSNNLLSGNVPCSLLTMPFLGLQELVLNNCNIEEFPTFMQNLTKLVILRTVNNRLKGEVPKWLWSKPSLGALFLSHNSLNSFEGSPRMLLNSSLRSLDLRSNAFQGSFPVISPVLSYVLASDNSFTGEIPLSLCNQISYLRVLDLAHNNFSGSIPRCLITLVQDLDLGNNNLIGRLPDLFYKGGSLRTLDVSNNQITGKLPRSLTNCTSLEYLNVEGNRITDTFPFWLEELPNLKIIVLRSNMFHGPIYSPQHPLSFPELRMFDISRNNFTGSLPHDYFVNWSTPLLSAPQKIPQSTQFGGQPKSSFEGNLNLCGRPLLESCFQDKVPSTPEAQELEPSKQEQVFNWKAAAMGYGPGVLFGLAIGQVLYSYKPVLFFKLFRL
ncbi:hypothetical protein IGI04_016242 [Brassica rapa subsp. trilocularis]|uniref:Leucine-rich repeat-containing N-terminal plant-type domain-containing protein n=1 Tax=Brassica rapa subsp. trilocularis TaxID=1813537 RepID=A0ABQ7MUX1_BRACM|nr:hypothetical protein IGI04_016242 [Brassica rapa subsp. trilocularis]